MSASREKKQRQQDEGLTEKQRQQALEARKDKARGRFYLILGVVIALLVAALLIWNSGFFQRNATAVTVGSEKYTVADLSYYYYITANNTASTARSYAQYGINMGYDPDLSPAEQMYDDNTTYEEYFRQTAVKNLQKVSILCAEAQKAGYSLSEEGKSSVDEIVSQIESYSAEYGYSKSAYLKLLYGSYMTESVFLKQLNISTLANEYQVNYTDSLTYSDDQLETYYSENAANLDTYDYRYCFISGTAESTADAAGNTVEPTEEEQAKALELAKSKANEMVARYQAGERFNTLAKEYITDSSAESFSDPEYNHMTGKLGTEISSYAYGTWLMDSTRRTGDIGSVEASGSGYYVVLLLGRERSENTYQSVDVRHILVNAESEADTLPNEAQLADAKAEAERLLAEWKSGEATSESFAQLANLNSDDTGSNTNGGLYEGVERGTMITSFNDWIFAPGRKAGDTGIVVNTDGQTDDVRGYHVMYLQALGPVRWRYQAESALSSADFNTWYTGVEGTYPVTNGSGYKLVK